VSADRVFTIEGNTSSTSGVVDNGGMVCKKSYPLAYDRIAGYGRPDYDVLTYVPTVLEWQKAAIADGYKFPRFGADGQWGSECHSVAKQAVCKRYYLIYKNKNLVKLIQKAVGLDGKDVDGKFGKQTEEAVEDFQASHGLVVDGVVGLRTWMAILSL
jgi:peptidoglycan hydrolase-like protein with peptidoglycan-binding domain